jgi:V/A-type H+-transporting ATPase subunit K
MSSRKNMKPWHSKRKRCLANVNAKHFPRSSSFILISCLVTIHRNSFCHMGLSVCRDIIKYGVPSRTPMKKGKGGHIFIPVIVALTTITFITVSSTGSTVFAQEEASAGDSSSFKLIGAGMAFGLAALGAGIGLGYVGAAGLAAISDNPKMQSRVFIIVGMVESIAIYGIVMMFIILGQA